MDGEEKVRILAWRQEKAIMKKFSDVLRGQGHFILFYLYRARYSQISVL